MKNILLIEDEDNLNRGISLKLQKEGYTVFSAATVAEGLSLFQANTIDLVICDIGLPDGSGLDLCASIRQKSDVLFLFLTALDTEVDMITGYEMGADDYVTKPFSMSVLISKISAMLKRTEKTISNVVQTGELTFYINEKRVTKGNDIISITPTDWKLLMAFIEHHLQNTAAVEQLLKALHLTETAARLKGFTYRAGQKMRKYLKQIFRDIGIAEKKPRLTIKYSDFFSEDLMEASETLDTADLFN